MATNKELVEQAVAAIPLWRAFLDKKEAEQNLILEQMQDDQTRFAPKSLTERLTERFRPTSSQPLQTNAQDDDLIVQEPDQAKLEQEAREEVKIEEEQDDLKETKVTQKQKPASSNDDGRPQISNKEFKDIF